MGEAAIPESPRIPVHFPVVPSVRTLSPSEKRELVQRVVQSQTFASSQALRAFLLYVTEHTVSSASERIKEQRIGCEVLGRKPDYDPATDNIVRVRAHELRQRLDKYFSTEGAREPVVVSIPKGTYVPAFAERPPASQSPPASLGKRGRLWYWLPWALSASLAGVVLFLAISNRKIQSASRVQPPPVAMHDFWSQFFHEPGQEMMAIAADSSFALWQDMAGTELSLADYLSRKYLQIATGNPKLRELVARRSTSPADLALTLRLAEVARIFGGKLNSQYARNVDIRELRRTNVVLIGSRRSNPWVELFERHMNFVLTRDPRSGAPLFENRKPKAGERATYAIPGIFDADGTEQNEFQSYAMIAIVPNLAATQTAILVEGLNMQATEAAGEIVTNPERLQALLHHIGHKEGKSVPPFEALIKLTSVPGGYTDAQAIAFRYSAQP
ncbi:MAG TPA: hypothetical protein VK493_07000 [Bryobacteraceae bacterium]|nr:hypothetical protein [Bryobacteraceae bacterium]